LQIQAELAAMPAPPENQLPTAMTFSATLTKGVYHTTALTTTAGITLTFDGEGVEGHWLINSDSFIAFGASTKMVLKDVTPNSTITWNSGSYTSSGASTDLIGSFFAFSYILTGELTKLKGIGDACGGLFTTTGAVTLGASNTIGPFDCTLQPPADIDHYQIIHDGQGLTCEAETVIIKACTNTYDGSCTLSEDSVTLDVKATGSSSEATDRITFTGSGNANIPYTVAETSVLSLVGPTMAAINPTVCFDGNTTSCDLVFAEAGFRFLNGSSGSSDTITNQISATTFPLRLQAVKNNNGVCEGLFTGNKAINLSQENVEPGGTGGLSFSIDGNNIEKHPSVTSTLLNFGADSIAELTTPIYHDAGQIRLHANYNVGGVTLMGSSNAFWVSPAKLVTSAISGATNLNGASVATTITHAAGEIFDFRVTALNRLGVITPNYFPVLVPGQEPPIQLRLTRTGPLLIDSVDGNLSYAASSSLTTSTSAIFQNVTLTNFSSGVSTYSAAQYSEVGLINLDVQDSDYGGAGIVIPAAAINIGRFIPHHFEQTVAADGFFDSTCAFGAYSGQNDEATNSMGAITYLTNPILAISAHNKQHVITQNYFEDSEGSINDYMKLSATGISITPPTLDQLARGVDNNQLPLTANMNTGTLSQSPIKGVLHYQFSDNDNFFYERSANALVAPFTSAIDFSIATISDADNVNVTTTDDASPTGVQIRFGRISLANSFGPETSNLPQPMQLRFFNGTAFTLSSDDNCASYDASRISLTNISLDPALTNVLGGAGLFVVGETEVIELEATGAGNTGAIGVSYDAFDWLKFDWDSDDGVHDDDPSAVATFGIYQGDERRIYSQ